jgi:hypothetical protein
MSVGLAQFYRGFAIDTLPEMINRAVTRINHYASAFVMTKVLDALKTAKFNKGSSFTTLPTQAQVDDMISYMYRLGDGVTIYADRDVITAISKWNGFIPAAVTGGTVAVPFYTPEMVNSLAQTGVYGYYNGAKLVVRPNRFLIDQPVFDTNQKFTGFKTEFNTGDIIFIPTNSDGNSAIQIITDGEVTSFSQPDVDSGEMLYRFDTGIGAGIVPGREFEIGYMWKQA